MHKCSILYSMQLYISRERYAQHFNCIEWNILKLNLETTFEREKNKCRYYGYFPGRERSNRDSLSKPRGSRHLLKDPVLNLLSSCYSYRDTRSYISALYILQCSINDMAALKRRPSHSHFFVSPSLFFSFPFRGSQEKSHFPSLRRNRPAFSPLTSIAKNNVTR